MKFSAICVVLITYHVTGIVAQFLECSTNTDCIADNAVCQNNLCECPVGYIFSTDGTNCLPIIIGPNVQCSDDNQCGWLLGKYICTSGACACAEGWRYYEGRCIQSVGLNQICQGNENCFNGYDILAMICNAEGVCACNEGYYLRGDYDCRPEITELGDYCSLDMDCKTEGSSCIGSFCVQTPETISSSVHGYKIKEDIDNQLKKENTKSQAYAIDCTGDNNCAALPNSFCYQLTQKCVCRRGYFMNLDETSCTAELGIDVGCTTDDDCAIPSSRCMNGQCYCRKTYFTTKLNTACQKPMTQDNLFCNSRERCYVLGTAVTCNINTHTCQCAGNAEMDENYICRQVNGPGTGLCNDNTECQEILTNSICNNGRCECPLDYYLEETQCLPYIGAACDDTTRQCMIENTVCNADNNVCQCTENYVQNEQTCLQVATGLEGECEIDLQCTDVVPNTECNTNICKCLEEYISVNEACYEQKYIGDRCTNSEECHVLLSQNVLCRNNICQCNAEMVPTSDRLDCENSANFLKFSMGSLIIVQIYMYIRKWL